MIDTDKYENMTWETPSDELEDAVENLLAEVKRLNRRLVEADCLTDTLQTIADNQAKEVKRLKTLLYHISDLVEAGLCYSDEWWATDDCDEQEKLPLRGLKIADSGVYDWPNVHFCSKKIQELRRLLP